MSSSAIQLAQHYFDLSNRADLDAIEQLFTPSSTYSSANTGVYLGADNIIAMQRRFFAGFSALHWSVHDCSEPDPGIVLFDFAFTGTTTSGEHVARPGLEYVVVYAGKLQHVEVRNKP